MKSILGVAAAAACLFTVSGCAGISPAMSNPTTPVTSNAVASKTVTATPTPTASPTPSVIATSGSYAADLAKLGIKPDTVSGYSTWMKEMLCDKSGTSLGVSVRSIGGGTASSGGGPETVRLTVAYFCPSKSAAVEKELEYFKQ